MSWAPGLRILTKEGTRSLLAAGWALAICADVPCEARRRLGNWALLPNWVASSTYAIATSNWSWKPGLYSLRATLCMYKTKAFNLLGIVIILSAQVFARASHRTCKEAPITDGSGSHSTFRIWSSRRCIATQSERKGQVCRKLLDALTRVCKCFLLSCCWIDFLLLDWSPSGLKQPPVQFWRTCVQPRWPSSEQPQDRQGHVQEITHNRRYQ